MHLTLTAQFEQPAELLTFLKSLGNTNLETTTEERIQKAADADLKASFSKTPKSEITLETVREAVQKKALEGKRDEVKKILSEFKAPRVTDLKDTQYVDFLKQIEAL